MEDSKWTMEVGEVFTVEREECASTGLRFALCRLEGGIVLLETHTEYHEPIRPGARSTQVFVFKCVMSGDACIQFGYSKAPETGRLCYEEVLPIQVVEKDKVGFSSSVGGVCGGWSPVRELEFGEKELFEEVMQNRIGISYKPVSVCTQIVNGTNYRYTCQTQLLTNPPRKRHAHVYIFKPLEGSARYEKTVFLLGDE